MYLSLTWTYVFILVSFIPCKSAQLIGRYILLIIGFRNPYHCITVKQTFDNLRLLAGHDTKPIGAGLGRDNQPYPLKNKNNPFFPCTQ